MIYPTDTLELSNGSGGHIVVHRSAVEAVIQAFGFYAGPYDVALETIQAVALAHHLLGLKDEQFRETGLMLAQRPDTWREFDSARRLGAQTFELQRILLGGLFNEVPK